VQISSSRREYDSETQGVRSKEEGWQRQAALLILRRIIAHGFVNGYSCPVYNCTKGLSAMRSPTISIPMFAMVSTLLLCAFPCLLALPVLPPLAWGGSSGTEADGDSVVEKAEFYQYTDRSGVIHFVDSIENIPKRYRNRLIVRRERTEARKTTEVKIVNKQILVPVSFKNGNRREDASLILDTGASITCITENLASRLGIDMGRARVVSMGMADGSMVDIRVTTVSSLSVGDRLKSTFEIGILPQQVTAKEHEGYLGLDFIGEFQHQIDFQNSLIRWQ
jgi:hypothetical protein